MSDDAQAARRKRILFRSWHRGMREMDMLLGRFTERHIETFSERQLGLLEAILECSDPEIYAWISEREPVPPFMQSDVMTLLKNFKISIDNY